MKTQFLVILFATAAIHCIAQKKSSFNGQQLNKPDYFSIGPPNSSGGLSLAVDKDTRWVEPINNISNESLANAVFLDGAKQIGLSMAVPKDSIKYYRYNIIENDVFWAVSGAALDTSFALHNFQTRMQVNLGKFDVENKNITVEFWKINERNKVSRVMIYNRPIKPATLFLTTLAITAKNGDRAVGMNNEKDGFKFKIHGTELVNSILLSIKPSDYTFIYQVSLKNLTSGKTTAIGNNWVYGFIDKYPYQYVDASFFTEPGNYEISILPKLSTNYKARSFPELATKIRFSVLESEQVFPLRKILMGGLGFLIVMIAIASLIYFFSKIKNRRKIEAEQQQKELSQMQLSIVRSQLNPHFTFNALSGIQSLINRNEIDQANRYLAKFARITRNVLNNSDVNTIEDELVLVNDYLQMEQLRFGFQYTIEPNPALGLPNIEIPSLILLPILENAVKHGISQLEDKSGVISIKIDKNEDDLTISISDNGRGFEVNKPKDGLGLKLTTDRIKLLNAIDKDSIILIDIRSEVSKTSVVFTFKNWL